MVAVIKGFNGDTEAAPGSCEELLESCYFLTFDCDFRLQTIARNFFRRKIRQRSLLSLLEKKYN
jgi:hypothetical protein